MSVNPVSPEESAVRCPLTDFRRNLPLLRLGILFISGAAAVGLEELRPSDPGRSPVLCRWEIRIPERVISLILRILTPYLIR